MNTHQVIRKHLCLYPTRFLWRLLFPARLASSLLLFPFTLCASIQIWESGEYIESFDSLPSDGGSNSIYSWTDNNTLPGWYIDSALNGPLDEIRIGPHSSNGGSIYVYSFGSPTNDTDRALGAAQTSTNNNHFAFGLLFHNVSGGTVHFNEMHYDGEQYRYSGQVSQTNHTFYQISSSPITSPSASDSNGWIALTQLDFLSPAHSGNNPDSLAASTVTNGNDTNYRRYVSGDISEITLNPGEYIMFRFLDTDYGGSDHALAYDNLYIDWTVTGGMALSWGGIEADPGGNINSGRPMGWIYAHYKPWLWSYSLERWIYAPDPGETAAGFWSFIPAVVQSMEPVETPQFSPAGGIFSSGQTVGISTTTSGATIRYTTDGSTPTSTYGTVYTGPVEILSTTILKAIAYHDEMTDSDIQSETYTISSLSSTSSYWSSVYPVSGGWELDPSGVRKAGIPPDTILTPHTGSMTFSAPQTITDREFIGTVNVESNGVTFVRCRFTAANFVFGEQYATGDNIYVMRTTGGAMVELIDCELFGGSSSTFLGSAHMTRCWIAEGNDCLKVLDELTLIECVIDGAKRSSSSSHSDAIQSSTNAPSSAVHRLYLDRCWNNVYNRRTDDLHNACIMMGSYGDPAGGITGYANDCWFGGGNAMLNRNGGTLSMTFSGNRFSRNSRYGVVGNSAAVLDSTNVWADTLQPVYP